jgi:hypothetical protein
MIQNFENSWMILLQPSSTQPIAIQKIIHILITWHKEVLMEMQRNNNTSMEKDDNDVMTIELNIVPDRGTSNTTLLTSIPRKRCYGNKC